MADYSGKQKPRSPRVPAQKKERSTKDYSPYHVHQQTVTVADVNSMKVVCSAAAAAERYLLNSGQDKDEHQEVRK
jgi:hypothetical protein